MSDSTILASLADGTYIFEHETANIDPARFNPMKFHLPLITGTLIKRYRRFLVDVRLADGSVLTAHCPNSGSMVSCCEPGRTVILSDSGDSSRRHALTWELIDMDGTWVGVNPAISRKIVNEAIEKKLVPSLARYDEIQRDASYGRKTKVDIVLHGMEENCFINIHNVTWVENDSAFFPDAINERAKMSLLELAEIAKQKHRAVAFYFVQRGDCARFMPAAQVDRDFMKLMLLAQNAGVEIVVYRGVVSPEGIDLGTTIPYALE
jgi:sugar fermentation stimulation protein A